MKWIAVCLIAACPGSLALAFQDGFLPEWEVRRLVDSLHTTVQKFDPLLGQFQPEAWVKNGASPEYVRQTQLARQEIAALRTSAERLAKSPGRAGLALDAYLRLENLEQNLNSVNAAARRYQSPELAESIENAVNESSSLRQKLRGYLVDLVGAKERESDVMDNEAQRCRGMLSKVLPTLPPNTKPVKPMAAPAKRIARGAASPAATANTATTAPTNAAATPATPTSKP